MAPQLERVVDRLRDAEEDLAREIEEQQRRWHFRVHRGQVWFDREVARAHRRLRQSVLAPRARAVR